MSFVRRSNEVSVNRKQMFGGAGEVEMHQLLRGADEMYGKGRLFNHVVLELGTELGWHVHEGDGETYFIIRGEGEYNDNGAVTTVAAGDVTFVGDGEGHSIKNTGSEPLEFVALILYC